MKHPIIGSYFIIELFRKDHSAHEVLGLNRFLMKIISFEPKTGLVIQQVQQCHLTFTKFKCNRRQWKVLHVIINKQTKKQNHTQKILLPK